MREIVIKGKKFSEEEVVKYGNEKLRRNKKTLLTIGIVLLSMTLLATISLLTGYQDIDENTVKESLIPGIILYSVIGIILIIIGFLAERKDKYEAGVAFLNKHFPYPVGFDGNIIDPISGDKTILLSKKPIEEEFIISFKKYEFQIRQGKTYSKIYSSKDILSYEILRDNKVVISSHSYSKKGVGKAVAGGLLFGGVGMVAGALAANTKTYTRSTQQEITRYKLVLRINDITNPSFILNVDSLKIAEEIFATLGVISNNNNELELEKSVNKEESKIDKFDEIKKYKELLDIGAITQEEFNEEKKKLLNK